MLSRASVFAAIDELLGAPDRRFAVMVLRLPELRQISLRYGYAMGEQAGEDALAVAIGSVRPGDRVFRTGDDSFVLLLPGLLNHNHALLASTRLIRAFEQPLGDTASPWRVHPVMGVALYPDHGASADLLCRRAEMAVDEAQRRGELCAIHQPHDTQVEIFYDELRDAIAANRMEVFFQPIHQLASNKVIGVESLARWSSSRHGRVSPSSFVPFSEQSDLISALTRWSINATLRHAAKLPPQHGLAIAINFSPRVLSRAGMVEQLLGAFDIWGVPATSVIAEITETTLANDLEQSVQVLRRLRDRGVRIAIDDFGTGYASIAYLRQFPATELKLDQSLITGICHDPRMLKLVRAIVNMAHHMDMVTTAEGIEDQATQDVLTDMGCDFGQGFHLGRPEPATDFVAHFSRH